MIFPSQSLQGPGPGPPLCQRAVCRPLRRQLPRGAGAHGAHGAHAGLGDVRGANGSMMA